MKKPKKRLALFSIVALVLFSLVGGVVTATANQGKATTAGQSGTEGTAGLECGAPPASGGTETNVKDGGGAVAQPAGAVALDAGVQCQPSCCTGKICGTKFLDSNRNTKKDAGEAGLAGVTIELWKGSSRIDSTVTATDGSYCFDGLDAGTYTVKEVVPAGYSATTSTSYTVGLCMGETEKRDFGNALNPPAPGSICGKKWLDGDEDGAKDPGEPGMQGVTIELRKDGSKIAETVTGADGSYSFTGLEPGIYSVREIVPSGYHATTADSYVVEVVSDQVATRDFGNALNPAPLGSISGHKWRDYDWDGEHDAGEPGVGGVTIELWKDGSKIASATTAVDGSYSFTDLEPGAYTVKEAAPAHTAATSLASVEVSLGEDEDITGIDFLNRCAMGVVEVLVYGDTNCNGVLDGGDQLLPTPVKIQLYHVLGGSLVPADGWDGSYEKLTGAGVYPAPWWEDLFPWLPPSPYPAGCAGWKGLPADDGSGGAEYLVKMVVPDGWYAPAGTEYGPFTLKCIITCSWQQVKFLLAPKSHLAGFKYEDTDLSGDYGAGDGPVEGVTIELYKGEEKVASTATAADGSYIFDDLEEGTYTVKEVLPAGWYAVDPDDGAWEDVAVGCGDVDGKNFLNCRLMEISGHKYEDADLSGDYGAGDGPVEGVTIELYKGEEKVASTATAADGSYSFTGLEPGTYTVKEVLPAGWYAVDPDDGAHEDIELVCGQNVTGLDFLNCRYGDVEGWKYWDKDQNGLYDEGEGLEGVTIILTPEAGPEQTAETGIGGHFYFGPLKPGTYTVSVDESTAPGYYPIGATSAEVEVERGKTTRIYFTEAPYASISGHKWLDANCDGLWDAGETTAIAGITIKLYKGEAVGDPIAVTVTGEDGSYSFTGLEPGLYTVVEDAGAEYFSANPTGVGIELSAGEGAVIDFGNCPYGRILGTKIDDYDSDGARDSNEPGLEGVQITLQGMGETGAYAVTATGEDGSFVFNNLLPGEYTVSETVPDGYYATRPIEVTVTVGPAESITVVFTNAEYAAIVANKWMEKNGNGKVDSDVDEPKAGIKIKVTGETLAGAVVNLALETEEDGSCSFLLLEAGDYEVEEVLESDTITNVLPTSVDVPELMPGDKVVVDFLNTEVRVEPQPPIKPEVQPQQALQQGTLPQTGINELPAFIAAGALILLGLLLLVAGFRRRFQE